MQQPSIAAANTARSRRAESPCGPTYRQVEMCVGADGARQLPADRRECRVGQERDRARARREAVEPVGQVDGAGRAGEHEEDERVPAVAEVDVRVDEREVEARREPFVVRDVAEHRRDRHEQPELPAPRQAERALVGDLRVVVDEPDRGAGHGHAQHREGLRAALGEDQERDRGHRQDQQAAHGRRALLDAVAGRPLLADVLAERALAQELDERAATEHRQKGRKHPCAEDVRHSATAASCSMPAEREPLSRTKSPGLSTRASRSAAAATSAAQCHSQPSAAVA